jgi:hypothetical protein
MQPREGCRLVITEFLNKSPRLRSSLLHRLVEYGFAILDFLPMPMLHLNQLKVIAGEKSSGLAFPRCSIVRQSSDERR